MEQEASVDIDAAPAEVWEVLMDVERWSEWTPSITSVRRLDTGPFAVGSTARVKQPRLRSAVWRVTELRPPRTFVWVTGSAGVTISAGHELIPRPGGGVTSVHTVQVGGLLAPLLALLTSPLIRRYVRMEAHGLKGRCEGDGTSSARP